MVLNLEKLRKYCKKKFDFFFFENLKFLQKTFLKLLIMIFLFFFFLFLLLNYIFKSSLKIRIQLLVDICTYKIKTKWKSNI
jgi:hypothetical protein